MKTRLEWQMHIHAIWEKLLLLKGVCRMRVMASVPATQQTHGAGQTKPLAGDNCSETCVHHNRRQRARARALSLSTTGGRLYLQVVLLGAQVNKATAARPPRPTLAIRSALSHSAPAAPPLLAMVN